MQSPFIVNEAYGLGYWLKDYGYYPKSLPLFTYMDHGVSFEDTIPPHEKENDAPLIFKFSQRSVEEYKKVSDKPVYCLLCPFIHYRIKNEIKKSDAANGTLFFVAHSTPDIDDYTNWNEFISNIGTIPEQFKPIDLCLYPTDIEKGLDRIFIENGFEVFTAGNAGSPNFTENFYSILKNYKYAMSNLLGSYTFYSVEMGIPFSLFGEEPKYHNKGDRNIELGSYNSYKEQPTYLKAVKLFEGFYPQITSEQLEFVNFELGKNHSISRTKASILLYAALIKYLAKHPESTKPVAKIIFRIIGSKAKNSFKGISHKLGNNIAARILRNILFLFKKTNHTKSNYENILINKKYITFFELDKLKYSKKKIESSFLLKNSIKITDSFWYLHMLKEIFAEDIYLFNTSNPSPYIIDCGSNIGLSVIYFKRLFPNARVLAFEADTNICGFLKQNLHTFKYDDVIVENKAVWKEETELDFYASGTVGGRLLDSKNGNEDKKLIIKIPSVRLKNFLKEKVDFLKIDIEGAEIEVLSDCANDLISVQNLFVEYHGSALKEQTLDQLLSILRRNGFRVYIKEAWNNLPTPFLRANSQPFFDLQLNIFAYRV